MTAHRKFSQAEKQTRLLGKGAGVNLIGKLVGRSLHVFGQILLARWLGPALFGLYAIGWNLLRMAATLLPMGMDNGVIQIGAAKWSCDKKGASQTAILSILLSVLFGSIAGLALFYAAPWVSSLFGKPDLAPFLKVFAIALPLASGLKVAAAATRISAQMRYGILSEELAQPGINLILIALLFMAGLDLRGAIWASVASFAAGFILAFFYVTRLFLVLLASTRTIIFKESRQLLSASLPVGAATIFGTLVLLVDRLLVGYFLSEQEAGIYQAISLFSIFFVTVLSAFKIIVAPMVASLFQKRARGELEELFRVSTKWVLYISLPAAAVLLLAPKQAITVVFGPAYAAGALSLAVLTAAQLANAATGAIEHFLIMTKNQKVWLGISSLMFVVNFILNIVLIPPLGILGPAVAMLITFAGLSLLGVIQVKLRLGIWPYDVRFAKGFVATFVTFAITWSVSRLDAVSLLWQLLVMGFVAYVSFGAVIALLGLEPEDSHLLRMVVEPIRRAGK